MMTVEISTVHRTSPHPQYGIVSEGMDPGYMAAGGRAVAKTYTSVDSGVGKLISGVLPVPAQFTRSDASAWGVDDIAILLNS